MASNAKQTAKLEEWSDIGDDTDWPTLLVGNGASVKLWGDFAYPSLYERANHSVVAEAVFADLGVTNFETVLEAIHHAHVVVEALGNTTDAIDAQCEQVRDALFGAVCGAHISWRFMSRTMSCHRTEVDLKSVPDDQLEPFSDRRHPGLTTGAPEYLSANSG